MGYHGMKRRELQAMCKKHNLPANGTNLQMADSLAALQVAHEKGRTSLPSCLKGSGESAGEGAVTKKVTFSLEQEKLKTVINIPDEDSERNSPGKRKMARTGSKIQQESVPEASKTGSKSKSEGSREEDDGVQEASVRTTRSRTGMILSKKRRGTKSGNSEEVEVENVQEDTTAKLVSRNKRGKKTGNSNENEIKLVRLDEEKKEMGEIEAARKEKPATRSSRRQQISPAEDKIPPAKQIDTDNRNSKDFVVQEVSDVKVVAPQDGVVLRKSRKGVQQIEKKDETSEVGNDCSEGIVLQKANEKTRSTRTSSRKSSADEEIQLGNEVSGAGRAEIVTGSRMEQENNKADKVKEAPRRNRRIASKKEVSVGESEERETANLDRKNRNSKRSSGDASEKEASVGENVAGTEIVDETGANNKQEEVSKTKEARRRSRRMASEKEVSVAESDEREANNRETISRKNITKRSRGYASDKEASVRASEIRTEIVEEIEVENKQETTHTDRKKRASKRSRRHAHEKEASVGENVTGTKIVEETGANNKQEEVSKTEEVPRRSRRMASEKEGSLVESDEREANNREIVSRKNITKRSRGNAYEKEASVGENVTGTKIVEETGANTKQEEVSKTEEVPRRSRRRASKKEVFVVVSDEREDKNHEIVCKKKQTKLSRGLASDKEALVRVSETRAEAVEDNGVEKKQEKEEVSKIEEGPRKIRRIASPSHAESPFAQEKNTSHKGEISPIEDKEPLEVTQSVSLMDRNDTGLDAEAKQYQSEEKETGSGCKDDGGSDDRNEILIAAQDKSVASEVERVPEEEKAIETMKSSTSEAKLYQSEEETGDSRNDRVLSFNDRGSNDENEILVGVEGKPIAFQVERVLEEENAIEVLKGNISEAKLYQSEGETGEGGDDWVLSFNDRGFNDGNEIIVQVENNTIAHEVKRCQEEQISIDIMKSNKSGTRFYLSEEKTRDGCNDQVLRFNDGGLNDGNVILDEVERVLEEENPIEDMKCNMTEAEPCQSTETGDSEFNDGNEISDEVENAPVVCEVARILEEENPIMAVKNNMVEAETCQFVETGDSESNDGNEISDEVENTLVVCEVATVVSEMDSEVNKVDVTVSKVIADGKGTVGTVQYGSEFEFLGIKLDGGIPEVAPIDEMVAKESTIVAEEGEIGETVLEGELTDAEEIGSTANDEVRETTVYVPDNLECADAVEITEARDVGDLSNEVTGPSPAQTPYGQDKKSSHKGEKNPSLEDKEPLEVTKEENTVNAKKSYASKTKPFQSEETSDRRDYWILSFNDSGSSDGNGILDEAEDKSVASEVARIPEEENAFPVAERTAFSIGENLGLTVVPEMDSQIQDGSEDAYPNIKVNGSVPEPVPSVLMFIAEGSKIDERIGEDHDIKVRERVLEETRILSMPVAEDGEIRETVTGFEMEDLDTNVEETVLEVVSEESEILQGKEVSQINKTDSGPESENPDIDVAEAASEKIEHEDHEVIELERENLEFEESEIVRKEVSRINKTVSGPESEKSNIEVEEEISEETEHGDLEVTKVKEAAATVSDVVDDRIINELVQGRHESENEESDEIGSLDEANESILECTCEDDGYAGIQSLFQIPNSRALPDDQGKPVLNKTSGSKFVAEERENKDTVSERLEYDDSNIVEEGTDKISSPEDAGEITVSVPESKWLEVAETSEAEKEETGEIGYLEVTKETNGAILECDCDDDGYAGIQTLFQTPNRRVLPDDQGKPVLNETTGSEVVAEGKENMDTVPEDAREITVSVPESKCAEVTELRETENYETDEVGSLEEAKGTTGAIIECIGDDDGYAGIQTLFQTPNSRALPDDQGKHVLNEATGPEVVADGRENMGTVPEDAREIIVSVPESKCAGVAEFREAENYETDEVGSLEEAKETNGAILECNCEEDGYAGIQTLFQTPNSRALPYDQGKPILNQATGSEVVAEGRQIRDPVSEGLEYEDSNTEEEGTDKMASSEEAMELAVSVPESKCADVAELRESNIEDEVTDKIGSLEEAREIIVSVPESKCTEVAEVREAGIIQESEYEEEDRGDQEVVAKRRENNDAVSERLEYKGSNIEYNGTDEIGYPEEAKEITVFIPESKCAEVAEVKESNIEDEGIDKIDSLEEEGEITVSVPESKCSEIAEEIEAGIIQESEYEEEDGDDQGNFFLDLLDQTYKDLCLLQQMESQGEHGKEFATWKQKEDETPMHDAVLELDGTKEAVSVQYDACEYSSEITSTVFGELDREQSVSLVSEDPIGVQAQQLAVSAPEGVENEMEINGLILEVTEEPQQIVESVKEEAPVASHEGTSEEEDDILNALRELFAESDMKNEMLPGGNGEIEDQVEKICALLKRVGITLPEPENLSDGAVSARRESIRIIKTLKTPLKMKEKNNITPFKSLLQQRLASDETMKENATPYLMAKSSNRKSEKSGNPRRRALENLLWSSNKNTNRNTNTSDEMFRFFVNQPRLSD